MKKSDREAKKLWVFQVCFPAADRNIYRMEAGRRGLTIKDFVRQAVEYFLKNGDKNEKV